MDPKLVRDNVAVGVLQPLFHSSDNPPTTDTSPQSLDLQSSLDDLDKTAPDLSASGRVRRMVGMTVDKLGRSKSLRSKSPPVSAKRMFGFNRGEGNDPPPSSSTQTWGRTLSSDPDISREDSPFVRPSSPRIGPSSSQLPRDGSMRIGTQTLIQALTAIPWTEDPDNEDDALPYDQGVVSEQEFDEDDRLDNRMASSIHTIHRPVARSRLAERSMIFRTSITTSINEQPGLPENSEGDRTDPASLSDEEIEDDFEPAILKPNTHTRSSSTSKIQRREDDRRFSSSASIATVRMKRRTRLADKLRDVFELSGIHQVIAEMPCWLLRSVLLQGYLYLTDSYLCFFAHIPSREDQVLKSGSMSKKAQRTKRWIKHWFILKNDVLSWYQSSADPYFPHGVVDLRYVMSCDPVDDKGIRLRTNQKVIKLSADSAPSRDEWMKAIRRVIFKAQHTGDSVKIAIPYSFILDVEKSSALDFSETIEVKVVDKADNFSTVDSYFFAYFQDLSSALDQIRDAVRSYRTGAGESFDTQVIDTTATRSTLAASVTGTDQTPRPPSTVFKFPSLWRPFSETSASRPVSTVESIDTGEEFTHINRRKSTFVPFTSSSDSEPTRMLSDLSDSSTPQGPSSVSSNIDHTYPPSTSHVDSSSSYLSSWGKPSWLKIPSRRAFSISSHGMSAENNSSPSSGITEVLTSALSAGNRLLPDMGFSILDFPDVQIDAEIQGQFRAVFAFDDKEQLLGYFPGYLLRIIPVYGRLFISSNYFCFKSSSGPLTPRIKMILPVRDVLSTEKCRAFHISNYGLVVIIRGYEELFFEFAADDRRASFAHLLETQAEYVRRRLSSGETRAPSQGQLDALLLEEVAPQFSSIDDSDSLEKTSDGMPSHMFTSTSSTFLTFKPTKPLHITCLTIGSRGDVQPYIALAKGLLADGHRVRIATHGEFKEWVESHGIEFGYVGGDPAELMRICVDNGMFTVSFLKEGVAKFRGWIDDLLKTSWEACQGTDLLIESPSAMGGLHIAEALEIPYFRAFTMTWTRTRAYPHAFAVPERKLGGNYNYVSYVLFDQVFWRGVSGQVNRWRRNTLGLPSTNLDKMEPHKVPFLYCFSPVLVPPPLDWPEWTRITGFWFLDDADVSSKKWTAPPDLVQFIETARSRGKKIVYVGFGSVVVSDPKTMTRCVVDAIVQSGVYAILSKGWSDRLHVKASVDTTPEPEITLPDQIYSVSSIPHDWLFKRIDAACHHGGAGTTGATVRAGIPTIIKPFFGDQFFWADRVEALGIGSAVRTLTVENLSNAFIAATTDQKQIQRARSVGEQIRAEHGVSVAIEAIYRDLEYSRSLTAKRKRNFHEEAQEPENATIRPSRSSSQSLPPSPERPGTRSSSGSATGATSDWSVISDQEDFRSSTSSRQSEPSSPQPRRGNLTATTPSTFSPASSPPRG